MSTERERIGYLVYYAAVLLVGYLAFQVVAPFLVPLGWAGVLAVCVYPIHRRGIRRLGATSAAALTTILVLILLVLPVWWIVTTLVSQGGQAIAALQSAVGEKPPDWAVNAWRWLQLHVPFLAPDNLMASLSAGGQRIVGALASASGSLLGGVALLLVDLAITLFALFFFLRDAPTVVRLARGVLPFGEAERDRVVQQVGDLIFASVIAGLAVAAVQGLLGGLAFWLVGLRAPVVWGTVMAFCALIPVAGTWVVWLPVAVWLLATGEVTRGLILMGVGAGLVASVDNVLRPILLSGRSSMNALVTFVALLGGAAAFGFIGLVFGPVVIAVAMALMDAYITPDPAVGPEPGVRS